MKIENYFFVIHLGLWDSLFVKIKKGTFLKAKDNNRSKPFYAQKHIDLGQDIIESGCDLFKTQRQTDSWASNLKSKLFS